MSVPEVHALLKSHYLMLEILHRFAFGAPHCEPSAIRTEHRGRSRRSNLQQVVSSAAFQLL